MPVVTDTTPAIVLTIEERQEDYPGVSAESQTLRQYPNGSLAAHSLGYVGPVNQDELDAARKAGRTDLNLNAQIGRAGLEKTYDADLRGTDGVRYVTVDNRGTLIGTQRETEPERGDTLVTSIDRNVQRIAEQALTAEIAKRRTERDKDGPAVRGAVRGRGRDGPAQRPGDRAGQHADVRPDGVRRRDLQDRAGPAHRPERGHAAGVPGGAGPVRAGVDVQAVLGVGGGDVRAGAAVRDVQLPGLAARSATRRRRTSRARASPARSTCGSRWPSPATRSSTASPRPTGTPTRPASTPHEKPAENLQRMARAYGFGSPPDIDLPAGEQTSGRIVDRAFKQTRWDANKATYCADAKRGYPEVTDPARRSFLTRLAAENCTDGWRFQVGDAANLAIGQGETTVSPLQLAVAYSALVNGGTLWEPRLGPGRRRPGRQGGPARSRPKSRGKVPVSQQVLDYIKSSLAFTPANGASGSVAFARLPAGQGAGRRQDRDGRGVRQAGHLVVRVLGAGRPAGPVRRGGDDRAGRPRRPGRGAGRPGHLRGHLRADRQEGGVPERTPGRRSRT